MAAPAIYRSSDTNAPVLSGVGGSLISLLDAILVNGYGSAFAAGAITSDGTALADGDTVTVGSITYTFRASLTGQPAYSVSIGGSASGSLLNLQWAINQNGTVGSNYAAGTLANPDVHAPTVTSTVLTLAARKGGSAGNVALSRASAGTPHLTVSGANMTGGSGSDTKAGAGWAKPYGSFPQGVYRQPAGSRFYLQVDDSGPGTGTARDARCFGFEAMTAYNVGSGQFPTPAQVAAGSVIRKSSTLDSVVRSWIAFVDDRTFYLFTSTGDTALNYHSFSFGDFYSLLPGDVYKCLIMGGSTEGTSVIISQFGVQVPIQIGNSQVGHWLSRNYSGFGGPTNFVKSGDLGLIANNYLVGSIGFPNTDGGLYLSPMRIADSSTPGTALAGTAYIRGRLRGLYMICHPVTSFNDGDLISGTGAYAGRTFQVVKFLASAASSSAFCAIETTPWAASV